MKADLAARRYDLNDVDLVRQRTGVGYEKARDALEAAKGEVVDALVWLEQRGWTETDELSEMVAQVVQQTGEMVAGQKSVTGVGVELLDRTICHFPTSLSGLAAAIVVLLGGLLSKCSVELELASSDRCAETADNTRKDLSY
jgi:hypothetical protein